MKYNEDYITKAQEKTAHDIIKKLTKGFDLEMAPEHVIQGLDPTEEVNKLEASKEGKDKKELKKVEKEIKNITSYVNDFVKIVFNFEEGIRTLVATSDLKTTRKFYVPRYTWTGTLDFPINGPIIFGRVCKKARHGGGTYCFAPFDPDAVKITKLLEEKFEKVVPDLFPYDIVKVNKLIELLSLLRFSAELADQMRTMFQLIKSKEPTGIELVDALNADAALVKAMKKMPHFGNSEWLKTIFKSEIDVSTIFFPYKETTIFQVDHFVYTSGKACEAMHMLVKTLKAMK